MFVSTWYIQVSFFILYTLKNERKQMSLDSSNCTPQVKTKIRFWNAIGDCFEGESGICIIKTNAIKMNT